MSAALQRRTQTARQRLECVQLAAAVGPGRTFDSGSKLRALQTFRENSCQQILSQPAGNLDLLKFM
jgi:hypothetical protein